MIVEPVLEPLIMIWTILVFSFIPNTLDFFLRDGQGSGILFECSKIEEVQKLGSNTTKEELEKDHQPTCARIENCHQRREAQNLHYADDSRNDLVSHVYDITYGGIRAN